METPRIQDSLRILIVAPTGRDGPAMTELLQQHRFVAEVARDLGELTHWAHDGVGAIIVAQEAMSGSGLDRLSDFLSRQPAWSDIPHIILAAGSQTIAANLRTIAMFVPSGNVTLLDRPFRQAVLLSAVQVALKARRKQYAVRDLLQQLDDRTRELARSNADLEHFAYLTSHDLQEPLRMIASYLQLIERNVGPTLDQRSRQHFSYVLEGAGRMKGMIDAVMQYARLERDDTNHCEIDLNEIFQESVGALRNEIEASGASIASEPLPRVFGNPPLLAKVFQNLISNALKFRGADAPTVSVSASDTDSEHVISVTDNGIGIETQQQDRIFKLFQRLHDRASYPGTGIGLATCRRIVERRGGRIWVDSAPGHGSTFRFSIPKQSNPAETAPRRGNNQPQEAEVVVVDDNPGDIELLQEIFRSHHPSISISGSLGGSALIDRLSRTEHEKLPQLVLIDLNMPGMDGKTLLSLLKNHPVYRGISAVMYTSSMRQSERQECLQLGADDYIVKPGSFEDYEAVIARITSLVGTN
jgi:signal transduction histidine kinase